MATMPENRLKLRAMTPDDIAGVHELSKAEQWPHRKQDLGAMLALGTGTVAEMGGELVASTMWWPCGESAATLGMIIVTRTHRGAGLGRIITEAVLDQIGDRDIVLNATEDGLPLYRKLGFSGVAEILQHQGAAFQVPLVPLDAGERIRPLGDGDQARVTALVQDATRLERDAMMGVLYGKGLGIVLDREGEITGGAVFRRFGRGYVIGPVIAPDLHRAKALIAQWLGARSGEFIRLDVPSDAGLGDWLEDLGIIRVGRVVTMLRGRPAFQYGSRRSFAIVSQALA